MAKWNFRIVGNSLVKELVPVEGDVQYRSQSFMEPSFDLQGDKIVIKESGAYKTAVVFSQIGEIDGVEPTDIQDAYDKLLTLVENFNGGGGTPGTTPNLPEVLAVSDRTFQDVGSNRNFEIADRTKYLLLFGSVTITLNEGSGDFPLNSLLQFRVFEDNVTLQIASGTLCYYLDPATPITSINLSVGDYCELKNISANNWILTVTNKVSNGSVQRGVFSGQFALSDAIKGGEYTPLTQSGALTLSIGSAAINGGVDSVKITANGSAITVPGAWVNIGGENISTTNGAVNRIMVRQYQSEIWYAVKVN